MQAFDPLLSTAALAVLLLGLGLVLTLRRGARLAREEARLAASVERLEERLATEAEAQAEAFRRAHEERQEIVDRLELARGELGDLRVANAELRRDLLARQERHDADVALLQSLRQEMTDRFKALADATLRSHSEDFGKTNRERMEALLQPVREQVASFQKELRAAHSGAAEDRARLKAEIDQLTRRSEQVSREAVALTNALKGDKQRQGAWGEMILETLLEGSGLVKGREYETQRSFTGEEGRRLRPDAILRMPGGRALVIDSKVSLVAYEAAVNAEDEGERAAHSRAHAAAVRRHIDDLAGRDYAGVVDGSVDYTLMFLPVESALAVAVQEQDDLTLHANARRIGIVTPTTLMLALRMVDHIWTVERRESNAEEIARRAGLLYDKVAGFVDSLTAVGTHLDRAADAHRKALGQLSTGSGNVLGQVEKLKRMGARTDKSIGTAFDAGDEAPRPTVEVLAGDG